MFEKAAAQGNVYAQCHLSQFYLEGRGVVQDFKAAAGWCAKAAAQGERDAQFNLGYLYEQGKGVAQDFKAAAAWYAKAAAAGDPDAPTHRDECLARARAASRR